MDVYPSLANTEMHLNYRHHQLTILAKVFLSKIIAIPAKTSLSVNCLCLNSSIQWTGEVSVLYNGAK